MKICLIIGTRPEIIKFSPIIRECQDRGLDYFVLHTGQHYSYHMDELFFQELDLPQPKYNLKVGGEQTRYQIRIMINKITEILVHERPKYVLVLGDTNSTLAGALAANRLGLKLVHLEGGLRSFDIIMAEEVNRMIADYLAEIIFVPSIRSRENLLKEGVRQRKIIYSGNTVVDAVQQNLKLAKKKNSILRKFNLKEKKYFLATIHRAENVDIHERLEHILKGFKHVCNEFDVPLVFPVHPRTEKMIKKFKFHISSGIKLLEPVGFLEFLQLEAKAKLIFTDSGGVQEEACILKVPCVTIRDNTERPETVEIGVNMLSSTEPESINKIAHLMLHKKLLWRNPYGDGKSAKRIISSILKIEKLRSRKESYR